MDVRSNPYAPPDAKVADPPSAAPPMPAPRSIFVARALIYTLIMMTIARAYLSPAPASALLPRHFELVSTLFSALFWSFIAYKIKDGRHWARVTCIILTLLASLSWLLPTFRNVMLHLAPLRVFLVAMSALVMLAAIAALLTPESSRWFKAMRESRVGR